MGKKLYELNLISNDAFKRGLLQGSIDNMNALDFPIDLCFR